MSNEEKVDFEKPAGYDEAVQEQKDAKASAGNPDIEPAAVVRAALPTAGLVTAPVTPPDARVNWDGVHSDAERKALEIARNVETGASDAIHNPEAVASEDYPNDYAKEQDKK